MAAAAGAPLSENSHRVATSDGGAALAISFSVLCGHGARAMDSGSWTATLATRRTITSCARLGAPSGRRVNVGGSDDPAFNATR